MSKKAFRVESGVDAGGFNVSNVADPRDGNLSDAVNVRYFIRENTVQPFDKTRTYKQHFAVTHENRLWIAKVDTKVGDFKQSEWQALRVDPVWNIVSGTLPAGTPINSGDYISAYSVNSELTFVLPSAPSVGDTIVIKDEGMYCHLNKIVVKAPADPIGNGKSEEYFTIPGSMKTFVYTSAGTKKWVVHTSVSKIAAKTIARSDQPNQLASGDQVYRRSSTGHITMQLPKYAADGDVISTYDYEGLTPVNGATVQVHPESRHTIEDGVKTSITTNTSDAGNFVFVGAQNRWIVWDGDNRTRWKVIVADYVAQPMENLAVFGGSDITLTLPKNASNGDIIRLTNLYRNDNTTLKFKVDPTTSQFILGDHSTLVHPKFKDIPKDVGSYPRVKEFNFSGLELGGEMEFYFHDDGTHALWMFAALQLRQEHVDETNRDRPGIAPLASQAEVDKNHEQNPRDDMIVTPKTLANSTATETRRGIARIATAAELQVVTSGTHLNDVIVTPKRLNERQSTESIRGVAEVATQTEANTNDNDTHIVTPKKLDGRRATVNMSGTVKIITDVPVAAANRTTPGSGIYNWSDATHNEPYVVTPKTLNQAQATENSRGVAYVATQSETNAQGASTSDLVIVTPKKLDARRATETLAGIAEVATQAETNAGTLDTHMITPKKLDGRRATEDLAGIAEIATQLEVNDGTDDTKIVSPRKFSGWMAQDHFVSVVESGIRHDKNLWEKVRLEIYEATETQRGTLKTATQAEANVQGSTASDYRYITPLKLDARRSTESLAGLAKLATQDETNAETVTNAIVSPKKLADYIHKSTSSNASETTRGTVEIATLAETWVGNTTDGSTQAVNSYQHNPFTVSPRGLNHALQNYLPKTAKAVDSDKLDGLDSLQFLRRDKDDTMTGALTVTKTVTSQLQHDKGYFTIAPFSDSYGKDYKCEIYFKEKDNGGTAEKYGLVINAVNRVASPSVSKDLNIWLNGKQVYHQGFKPTPAEIGAYTKAEADAKFVDAAGDTMTGDIKLPAIEFTGGDSNKWRFFAHSNGNIQFDNNHIAKWYMNQKGDMTTEGMMDAKAFRVNYTKIIEEDGKINWDKLKAVPAATTSQAGIVQLTSVLNDSSQTKAATANAIKILKEMIDEKAGITGAIMNDLKIREWIRIGNVILRPNPANKTLDFIWTDDPLE